MFLKVLGSFPELSPVSLEVFHEPSSSSPVAFEDGSAPSMESLVTLYMTPETKEISSVSLESKLPFTASLEFANMVLSSVDILTHAASRGAVGSCASRKMPSN
jgi:hypothetical protein